jgi:hypothetical protein
VLDNVQIAILTKVNELADRFGIKPYEFVAAIDNNHEEFTVLKFEIPVAGDIARVESFNRMLDLIGLGETTHELKGTEMEILTALDNALNVAPKRRRR